MKKLRKGDQVVILSGKDKGRTGTIGEILPNDQVIVTGINVAKKHMRPNPQRNHPGGIVDKEMPLHISKVAIWNPASKKGDRVGIRVLADGKRVRFFKSTGEQVDVK
ncbi:MAG: 50S ribosomal protein L24 [Pseudomonadota bacterium]|jgi:large subunit ribosomal protein L24|nr:MAG: 50S ribosomal protein L24 [Pseudomonadota bacterium]